MQGYKSLKRKGFTLVEEAVVIAIIAIIALPVASMMSEIFRSNFYSSQDIKGQYALNLIMQDIEQKIRRADSVTITAGDPYIINFTYVDADRNGNKVNNVSYSYELVNANTSSSIFYRQENSDPQQVFPAGLENGTIRNFSAVLSSSPPYSITITLSSSTGITMQKTVYLLNY